MEMNYASKGVAGTGLGLGIAGTAIGLLSNGGLANLFSGTGGCSDNNAVNRYELNQQKEITNRDMEIAYLKGRDAAKSDALELYRYVRVKLLEILDSLLVNADLCQIGIVLRPEGDFVIARGIKLVGKFENLLFLASVAGCKRKAERYKQEKNNEVHYQSK